MRLLGLLLVGFAFLLCGCGGGGSPAPGGELVSGVSFDVVWPERSRDTFLGPASALSANFVFKAAKSGGGDLVVPVNRVGGSGAGYVGSYTLPEPILNTTSSVTATFYSELDQGGQVVATATSTVAIVGTTVAPIQFVLSGKVASVEVVDPGVLPVGVSGAQLQFVAKDSEGSILGLTPGSGIWSMQAASGAQISASGVFGAANAGTFQVGVMVDGVTSPVRSIVVATGDGSSLFGVSIQVAWPARSRESITGLTSGLSVRVTFLNGKPGGGNLDVLVDRDATRSEAHVATYPVLQSIDRMTNSFSAVFYSAAGGAGQAVGYATGNVDASGDSLVLLNAQTLSGLDFLSIVNPGSLDTTTNQLQLMISAKNDSGETVALSAGSVFWTLVSGPSAGALTQDGRFTPSVPGDYRVSARVENTNVGPHLITVSAAATDDYNLVPVPNYNGNTHVVRASMNSLGAMVLAHTDGANSAVTTWALGGGLTLIDTTQSALSMSDQGIILEARNLNGNSTLGTIELGGNFIPLPHGGTAATTGSASGARIYPNGAIVAGSASGQEALHFLTRSTQPIPIAGSVSLPSSDVPRMNGNGELVGGTQYWGTATSLPSVLTAPAGATEYRALAISDNGVIVGTFAVQGNTHTHVCRWDSWNSAPVDLGALPSSLSSFIMSADVNSSGTIVGTYHGPNPDQTRGWIYSDALGLRTIETVIDASGTGYPIVGINQVLNNGWIGGYAVSGGYKIAIVLRPNP